MKRIRISTADDLERLIQESFHTPQLIFKHSSRCSISSVALSRIESGNLDIEIQILEVISNRELSNLVSAKFNVIHQSPQILIIFKGNSIFDTSHFGISSSVVEKQFSFIEF